MAFPENHGARNGSRKNNRKRKQADGFCFEYGTGEYFQVRRGEATRFQNKKVEGCLTTKAKPKIKED